MIILLVTLSNSIKLNTTELKKRRSVITLSKHPTLSVYNINQKARCYWARAKCYQFQGEVLQTRGRTVTNHDCGGEGEVWLGRSVTNSNNLTALCYSIVHSYLIRYDCILSESTYRYTFFYLHFLKFWIKFKATACGIFISLREKIFWSTMYLWLHVGYWASTSIQYWQ